MRTPVINELCEVLFDGRTCIAKVTAINPEQRTFDVVTAFKEPMYNIPYDKFKFSPSLGIIITNSINRDFKLNLLTVDAMDMSNYIDGIIEVNKWMVNI